MPQNTRRYLFDASATAISGRFGDEIIPIQAASALPSNGGFGSARVDGFRHKEILYVGSARTEVSGRQVGDDVFETIARSEIIDFNLLDTVRCERIEGQLMARHRIVEGRLTENFIVPSGSRFVGLRVGEEFFDEVGAAPDFFTMPEHASWTGLLNALENDRERDFLASLSAPVDDIDPVSLLFTGQREKLLGFQIALNPRSGFERVTPLGFALPDFGTVHLGEFFCEPTARRLVMLRVELTGDVEGEVVVGDPHAQGSGYPPG